MAQTATASKQASPLDFAALFEVRSVRVRFLL
jgi:hypothetical protein